MKRIYITGMSGTGKSSVIERLQDHGFTAINTDYDDWCGLSILECRPEWIFSTSIQNPRSAFHPANTHQSNSISFYKVNRIKISA